MEFSLILPLNYFLFYRFMMGLNLHAIFFFWLTIIYVHSEILRSKISSMGPEVRQIYKLREWPTLVSHNAPRDQ